MVVALKVFSSDPEFQRGQGEVCAYRARIVMLILIQISLSVINDTQVFVPRSFCTPPTRLLVQLLEWYQGQSEAVFSRHRLVPLVARFQGWTATAPSTNPVFRVPQDAMDNYTLDNHQKSAVLVL